MTHRPATLLFRAALAASPAGCRPFPYSKKSGGTAFVPALAAIALGASAALASMSPTSADQKIERGKGGHTTAASAPESSATGGSKKDNRAAEVEEKVAESRRPTAFPPPSAAVNERSGQTDKKDALPMCGQWCSSPGALGSDAPCQMDKSIIPCSGRWCDTTCRLWDLFVLGPDDRRRPVSCDLYKDGRAYPRGAELCDSRCLVPEVRKDRYPAPTGMGVMCRPGTCSPGACPGGEQMGAALGRLECPCNWFGSECDNDAVPVKEVRKINSVGNIQAIELLVSANNWRNLVRGHRPGGVVRVVQRDRRGTQREAAYALAPLTPIMDGEDHGRLEILISPPDPSLRKEVRMVSELIRSLESGPVSNLFVNPSISGFFNGDYVYLPDFLMKNKSIDRVVLLATGSGLSAAISAAEALLVASQSNAKPIDVYLYYGLRNIKHLPYQRKLEKLALSSDDRFVLKLILSGQQPDTEINADNFDNRNKTQDGRSTTTPEMTNDDDPATEDSQFIRNAIRLGMESSKLAPCPAMKNFLTRHSDNEQSACTLQKVYTQHAVAFDLSSEHGALQRGHGVKAEPEAALNGTLFVVSGRNELLHETQQILRTLCESWNSGLQANITKETCPAFLRQQVFTNI